MKKKQPEITPEDIDELVALLPGLKPRKASSSRAGDWRAFD